MKHKKIYYNYVMGGSEEAFGETMEQDFFPPDYFKEPTPALKGYDQKYRHAKCPAWKNYHKNTWVIHQTFPVGMKYESDKQYLSTNLGQEIFDQYFMLGDGWLDGEFPEVQFKQGYCFWTEDSDVWIEQYQHPALTQLGLVQIPGAFPISVWQRPVNLGFTIQKYDQTIWLEKDFPLCYVRFSSQRTRDVKFTLEKKTVPQDVHKRQLQNLWLKDWHNGFSWDLIRERLRKEEEAEKSCPINFLWNKKK